MEFAALKDIRTVHIDSAPGQMLIAIHAFSEIFTDVGIRDLRATLEMEFTEGERSGTRAIRNYLGRNTISSGPITLSFELCEDGSEHLELEKPARLYFEAFVLMGNPKVYRITNTVALDLSKDEN